MMRYLAGLATALLVLTMVAPARGDRRDFWTIDFAHTGLHYERVGSQVVAYTTYQVTNNTGADRAFYPIFRVETDTERLTYALPSPEALTILRAKHRTQLLDIGEISGVIKNGESRRGVAIFFRLDPAADHVKVFITGLTNTFRYQDEDNRKGFQRRVRFIHWFRPGDTHNRPEDRVDTQFDDWIWRSTGTAATAPAPTKE
jgi:hypothetical protein